MPFPLRAFPGIKSVRLGTVCDDPKQSKQATGFVLVEAGVPYLYTCWHVFTGQNLLELDKVPHSPPREIVLQTKQVEERKPGVTAIGGGARQSFPLYDSEGKPRWFQQKFHTPHEVWNERGVHVPAFFDVVKLPVDLPNEILDRVGLTTTDIDDNWQQPYPVGRMFSSQDIHMALASWKRCRVNLSLFSSRGR